MRSGAIFARGSCRALKWMTLFGVVLTLGVGQAVAQTVPTIETARYSHLDPDTRAVVITLSEAVFYEADDRSELPGRFTLKGGSTGANGVNAIRIDGLSATNSRADASFILGFEDPLAELALSLTRGATPAPLTLEYTGSTEDDDEHIVSKSARVALANIEENALLVVDTAADASLTLAFTTALPREEIEKPRKRGTAYPTDATPTKLSEDFILPAATGVAPGVTVTYSLGPDSSLAGAGVAGTPLQFASATRMVTGTLSSTVGSWPMEYSASAVGHAPDTLYFTINVAAPADAPLRPTVVAAGPSSLKVTWAVPADNSSGIDGYDLQYRPENTIAWLPDEDGIAIAPAAKPTYTIRGLAPGDYEVRVRTRSLDFEGEPEESDWSASGKGSTGAGPGKPTLVVTVDETIPEGRDMIPVKVTATVPPSAATSRTLEVTLALAPTPGIAAEKAAELPNTADLPSDLTWNQDPAYGAALPSPASATAKLRSRVLTLEFNNTNLSSEATAMLETSRDPDAEDEAFRITATTTADVPGVFAKATTVNTNIGIDDTQEQVYRLELPIDLASSGEIKEGYGGEAVEMNLVVSPARTVPKSFFVNLASEQNAASAYSLTTRGVSSGGPSAVSLRVDVPAGIAGDTGDSIAAISLMSIANDGDRVDDTVTLRVFEASATSPTTAGDQVGDDVMLTVLDQHKLPEVTLGSIMVDGAAVTSLKEGETGTVTLMADRGTATDGITDTEAVTVTLTHGAASSASADDYSLSSDEVTIAANGASGTFMLEVLADDVIDAEELVLQAAVTGSATYGEDADMVDLGPISFTDGTDKLVYPKTDEEIQAVIYPAKEAGMGDDMTFNPGEMIEIASPVSLFNSADGVTLSYTAMSNMDDVATVAVSGGMVTVTAQDMAGMAKITITAHASMAASGAKGVPQTDPSEASIEFPVEVGLEALSFMLSGPEDMNLVEGMSAMVTVTANRAVTEEVTVTLMRDRSMSTAGDDDYMAEDITIAAGMMTGTTMVMAVEDDMAEEMEELVLYGMAADNAGEVTGKVTLYIWDAAVPALPLIAQLLLGLFLAIGGYRRYLRR